MTERTETQRIAHSTIDGRQIYLRLACLDIGDFYFLEHEGKDTAVVTDYIGTSNSIATKKYEQTCMKMILGKA